MTTLYHYPLCPFSRKVRLLLRERSIDPDLITETFWGKRKEFLKMNPSGDVPVLIIKKKKNLRALCNNRIFRGRTW